MTTSTEERLEALEGELTRAKRHSHWLLAAVGLGVAVLGVTWLATETTAPALAQEAAKPVRVIRATAFVLVDDKGRERGKLAIDEFGRRLSLSDEKGKGRALLNVFKDEPSLSLSDEKGKGHAGLSMFKDGPSLSLSDEKGKGRALLGVLKDGPALGLFDEKGKIRAALGATQTVTPDGKTIIHPESSLLLFGADGSVIWKAPR